MNHSGSRAFTLIELLVVIAIIGILSAVVLAAVGAAREQAQEASLKRHAHEFRKLFELEYSDTGSYNNLKRGWIGGQGVNNETGCAERGYAGTYAAQAVEICNGIRGIRGTVATQIFHSNTSGSGFGSDHFSIMVRYPSGKMYCVGSSGRVSDQLNYTTPNLSAPGCVNNP